MVEQLSETQIAEFKEAFALFDRNGNGTIAPEQLGTVMRSLGTNPTNLEIKEYLHEIGSRKIDFSVFLTFMARKIQDMGNMEEDIVEAFKVFDKANTGTVSVAEIRHVITVLGETLTKEEADQMIRDADLDGSGKINYHQFAKVLCAN